MSYYQGPPQGYPPQGPPQGQYGAPPPPPQGYPPQQQPYGAPPPVGQPQYGQYPPPPGPPPPQHAGYGIPPVAQQYNQGGYPPPMAPGHYPPPQGAPYAPPTGPPQGGYPPPNPPPQTGYAPPPPQQQQGYAPPPQNYGYQPPPPQQYYDASKDVAAIRKATKGFGTDEAALINVLARGNKTAQQMEQLRKSFESQVGKSLLQVIEKETSGWFEYGLRGLILGPVGFDVWLLNRACDGAGTHEDILTEVLVGRTNEEMEAIKAEYHRVYHKNLVQVIQGELTFKTERLFNMILAANRTPEPVPVDPHQVESDIKQLYDAGQGRAGTDEIAFCGILMNRSNAAIRQITGGYKHHHRRSLESAILSEFSGHMQETLLQVVHNAVDPMGWDATLIDRAMEGAGTKDERLTYRIVRAYWKGGRPYVTGVKQAYEQKFKKNLIKRVKSETSGDYERLLVAILEG